MAKRKLTKKQSVRINKKQEQYIDINHIESDAENNIGIVISKYGNQADVQPLGNDNQLSANMDSKRCYIRSNLPALVTGDRVIFQHDSNNQGVVVARMARKNELNRTARQGEIKTVVANVDVMFIVIAKEPKPHNELIDRYIAAAEIAEIEPIIVHNKVDLCSTNEKQAFKNFLEVYSKIGYQIIELSAKLNKNIATIKKHLENKTGVFVGQSGVGKSSLINALLPSVHIKTGLLSNNLKGAHTTTTSRLYYLSKTSIIIDSPGIREFKLECTDPNILIYAFRELRPLIGLCKFKNCNHTEKSNCALLQSVESGEITEQRLNSYMRISNTKGS